MASRRRTYFAVAILVALAAALAGLEAAMGPFRGCYLDYALRSDAETGQRVSHFRRLRESGIIGRWFARRYASEKFKRSPPYGVFFVLQHRPLWLGMTRDDFGAAIGPAEESDGQSDTWYYRRKDLLNRHRLDPDFWNWQDFYSEWFEKLVAEYDGAGRVARLGIPGFASWPDANQSAAWLPLQKSEIPGEPPPPPPEWAANSSGAQK